MEEDVKYLADSTIEQKNMKKQSKIQKEKPVISHADQEMIDELDYEYKKAHKPYDKWERHWDEA